GHGFASFAGAAAWRPGGGLGGGGGVFRGAGLGAPPPGRGPRGGRGVVRGAGGIAGRLTDGPPRAALREARARLDGTAARLESVSPLAVLARGYALVT